MGKKYLSLAFSAIMLMMASCQKPSPATIHVDGVSLNSSSIQMVEGEQTTLIATVTPSDAENKKVSWSTSDSSVATVENGKVTAIKAGSATITVKTEDGNKTASCAVTVTAKTYPVESVTLDKSSLELTEGTESTLTATVNPANATNKKVTWSTSDSSVATVENGKVTAIKVGTATITVKTEDGNKTASCAVTVKARTYPVESVTLDKSTLELTEGTESTLTATVNPANATNKKVTWSTSDSSVATVENGKVTAIKAGTATITVKTEDGNKTASCNVTVKKKNVGTEKDNGGLNFGAGGGAGDNIDEEKDIFNGGSF